jgi:hypothetical protein
MSSGAGEGQAASELSVEERAAVLVREMEYDAHVALDSTAPDKKKLEVFVRRRFDALFGLGVAEAALIIAVIAALMQGWDLHEKRNPRCPVPTFKGKCGKPFIGGIDNGMVECVDGHRVPLRIS